MGLDVLHDAVLSHADIDSQAPELSMRGLASQWHSQPSQAVTEASARESAVGDRSHVRADAPTSALRDPPDAPEAPGRPECPCGGGPCVERVSHTAANPGRVFLKCPLKGAAQCKFFKWADQIPGYRPSSAAAKAGGKAGPDAAPGSGDAGAGEERARKRRRATLAGHPGQPFDMKGGASGADGTAVEGGGVATAEGAPVRREGGADNTCFVCGAPGHWARDCPQRDAPGRRSSRGEPGHPAGQASTVCFKCHAPGHWAKDCPA